MIKIINQSYLSKYLESENFKQMELKLWAQVASYNIHPLAHFRKNTSVSRYSVPYYFTCLIYALCVIHHYSIYLRDVSFYDSSYEHMCMLVLYFQFMRQRNPGAKWSLGIRYKSN